jgi:dCTP deaminase
MTCLSSSHLRDRLYHEDASQRLVVTPLLDLERQVSKAAIDVRLGCEFIVLRHTRLAGLLTRRLNPTTTHDIRAEVEELTEMTYVQLGSAFVLHPGQFVLTSTLEYVSVPSSLMAYVIGRSSWGRLGLNIATATMVAPGFKGSITFEMLNMGTVPIGLYPGSRVAQLVFHRLSEAETGATSYGSPGSKYLVPIGPEFSKIDEDDDWKLLQRFVPSEAGKVSSR